MFVSAEVNVNSFECPLHEENCIQCSHFDGICGNVDSGWIVVSCKVQENIDGEEEFDW